MRTGTVTSSCQQPGWFTPSRCSVPRELGNPHLTRVDSPGSVAGFLLRVCGHLDGPNGFAESDVSGYYPWHTPRTPALVSRELGDSRRAPACPGVVMRIAGLWRSCDVARRAGVTPCHEAGPERAVGYGGHWWGGLTNAGGLWPGRIRQPEPGAGARGRSTAAGPGGGTTLGEGHRWRHRLYSLLGDGRPPLPQVSANTTTAQSSLGAALGFPRCPIRRGG